MTTTFSHPTIHRDGTVTYWSVYDQVWVHRAERIPDQELAAMTHEGRERVIAHLAKRRPA